VRTIKDAEGDSKEKTKAAAVAKSRQLAAATPAKLALVVNIKGKAATDVQVARFIACMARHPLTDSVDLSYSKQSSDKSQVSREFQLTVQLKPNADALDAIKPAPEDGAKQARDDGDKNPPRRALIPVSVAGGGA
jgi:Tfp pilus assembly protein PilN